MLRDQVLEDAKACAGKRTARLVNPLAWQKGLVFAQCKGCEVWHKLRDNENLIDEVKFTE